MDEKMNELIEIMGIINEVKEKTKAFSDITKRDMLCMFFDELFREKSVEAAEMCLEQIKSVNTIDFLLTFM